MGTRRRLSAREERRRHARWLAGGDQGRAIVYSGRDANDLPGGHHARSPDNDIQGTTMTPQTGLQLIIYSGVPVANAVAAVRAADAIGGVVRIEHRLAVHVLPAAVLAADTADPAAGCGFGAFTWRSTRRGIEPVIYLAGDYRGTPAEGEDESARMIATTLAHELVHYEQWRDLRQPTERSVERRAKYLLRNSGLTDRCE